MKEKNLFKRDRKDTDNFPLVTHKKAKIAINVMTTMKRMTLQTI